MHANGNSTRIFQTFARPLIQRDQLMSKVWPWGSYSTDNRNILRLCLLMHVHARKKVRETADWTQTCRENERTERLTTTRKPGTAPPPVQTGNISSMTVIRRLNLTMAWLMVAFATLLLATQVSSQEMPYEHLMSQLQECPKECRCPPSFPNAVYCDNKGLKRIPVLPPYTFYLYLQNNLIDVLSADALRNATQLRWINLNRNKITSEGLEIDALRAMTNLVHLYMEDNLLTSIPSPLPTSLEQLRLSRNRISKIPAGVFSGMEHLTLLDLQSNKLQDDAVTEVSLKGLSNLVQINLAKNQLNNMPLGLPPTTSQIFLDSNNIEKISADYFKGLPKVLSLRLNRNKLGNGGIPKNVFNLSSILDLQLSHNQLTEVPIISTGLEHLHLDHNKIKSVNGSNICPAPAGGLDHYFDERGPRLRYLRLDGNEIKPPIPQDLMMCFRLLRAVVI